MPPSRHSSSSHHSSRSSHHSSHSSHSSRSSYRSHSGGSGRHHSTMSSYRQVKKTVPRPDRTRINQPLNYNGKKAVHRYNCISHDYVYYAEDWVDVNSGIAYQRGYYDETGERFDTVIIDNNGTYESRFDCPYCGTSTKETWTEGAAPHCPNCGANLIETQGRVIMDQLDHSTIEQLVYEEKPGARAWRFISFLMRIIFVTVLIPIIVGVIACTGYVMREEKRDSETSSVQSTNSNIELFGDSIYVESIDRTIYWKESDDSYYDSETDCYVWYNTDVEPAVWQYWYEGISSDYGDYGWMEYEPDEKQWYIEVGNNRWEELPEKYDTSKLWYMTGKVAGTSYTKDQNLEIFGQYIKVDSEQENCYWDKTYVAYYVSEKDCYLRVNFDVEKPSIHYWYEKISEKKCVDGYGGWMEYDSDTGKWYVVDEADEWSEVTEDTSALWHVESYITGESGSIFNVNEDGSGSVVIKDEEHPNIYIDYIFNPYGDDYITYENPILFQGDGYANMLNDFFFADEKELADLTEKYVLPHREEIGDFFEKEKNNMSASSMEELESSHYTVGKTLDVTDWFDETILIKGEEDSASYECRICKVELSVKYASYYGELFDLYDTVADQFRVDDQYVYVEGVSFEFFVE